MFFFFLNVFSIYIFIYLILLAIFLFYFLLLIYPIKVFDLYLIVLLAHLYIINRSLTSITLLYQKY